MSYMRSFLLLLGALSLGTARVVPRYSWQVSASEVARTKYDFVIAGGGVAGLTIADRLTENPSVNVLVIEAGPLDDGSPGVLIPGSWNPLPYLWPNLHTEPLTALNNRTDMLFTARVVGGGSTINAMNVLRATVADFEGWGRLGNEGWAWDDVFPYFVKSENFTAPDAAFAAGANITWDDSMHGHAGPLQYTYPNYMYPAEANWWDAAISAGLKHVTDPNGGYNVGLFWLPNVRNATTQTRCDARVAHYDRVIGSRPNYHLLTNTTVSKVLFEGETAVGVQYLPSAGGEVSTVYACKEVILAAGAFHTPQILQLSGVGPKKLLDSLQIPVISDLPGVGSNLQDQYSMTMTYNYTNQITPNADSLANDTTYNATEWENYEEHKPSPYTITKGLNPIFATVTLLDLQDHDSILAEAQKRNPADSLPSDTHPTVLSGYKAQRDVLLSQYASDSISTGVLYYSTTPVVQAYHMKPLSRGSVAINTTNPLMQPVISYRSGTDPSDLRVITSLVRKVRDLMAAPDMAPLGPIEATPGPSAQTDEQITEFLRQAVGITNAHQCCSAPMMARDLGGVLDSAHRVYGVSRLRVADVSFFPLAVSGGPNANMYMAGEKLAAMIKADHEL